MSRRGARAVVRAGSFALLASSVVAAAIVVTAGGFGADDLAAFLVWTLPFSVVVGVTTAALAPRLSRARPAVALALAGLVAVASAVLWTIAVALVLGPFVLAFSFPVFPCWVAGAASGLASALGVGADWRRTAVVAGLVAPLVVFVATAALLAFAPRPAEADADIDVVAYFRGDVTAAQMTDFSETRLATLEGVEGISADYAEKALYIEFTPEATEAERGELVRRLEASPLVGRIERDVPPDEAA